MQSYPISMEFGGIEDGLSDAEAQRVDGYILLGDYCLSNPEPDACVTRIRKLPNTHVIRGNEERYFETLMHQDQRTWTDGQMEISYWCYRNLSPENRAYLLSLPQRLELTVDGVPLHIAHSSAEFMGTESIGSGEHGWSRNGIPMGDISFEAFTRDIHRYFDRDAQFQRGCRSCRRGVYFRGTVIFNGTMLPTTATWCCWTLDLAGCRWSA